MFQEYLNALLFVPPRIFVCYRRNDAKEFAYRLADDLKRTFGPRYVFIEEVN